MKPLLLLLLILLQTWAMYAQPGSLVIQVSGIQAEKKGKLSSGIFLKENFPKQGKQLIEVKKEVTGTDMQLAFEQVEPGDYGIVVYQDTDNDGKLKTNWVGYPKEPIGFSRNAKIRLGPPAFEDAVIRIEPGKTLTISITLK
jgi:uncharacterized protein (DUF2141 family)